jgi:hypothetical protein
VGFVTTSANGNLDGTFDSDVHQDATTGNLSLLDEDGVPVTLERLSEGTGAVITYRLSISDDHEAGSDCDIRVKGTARLDTRTNTMTMPFRLKQLGCENLRAGAVITGTKLS